MAIDCPIAHVGIVGKSLGEELLPGAHVTGLPGERVQDAELRHRQPQRGALPGGGEPLPVQLEGSDGQRIDRLRLPFLRERPQATAAEEHLHARRQLAQGKRLAQVVVGTQLQAEHLVELLVAGGEEHHGEAAETERILRHTSSPSMRGMMMSRITRSGRDTAKDCQASAPSA